MAKKDFTKDLQSFVEKSSVPTSVPQETEQQKVAGKHSQYEKTTVSFPPELMGKLRMLCLYEGKQIREVLEEALGKFVDEYEQEHGVIRVPPRFRDNGNQ